MVNDAEKYASRITSNNSLESYPYNLRNSGLAACLSVLRIFNQPTAAPIAHFLDYKVVGKKNLAFDLRGGTLDFSLLPLKSKPPLVTPISEERISTPVLGMPFFHVFIFLGRPPLTIFLGFIYQHFCFSLSAGVNLQGVSRSSIHRSKSQSRESNTMPIELKTWITKDPTPAVFCQSSIPVIGRSHRLQFVRSVVLIGWLHAFVSQNLYELHIRACQL
ncbi:hypothetical protein PSTT_10574 [Puccinia striiformis]|uniref:Uncharacterized protein n=1 Tax=Puccinia striiformis TaxID=27350 RepID=A0A2S4V3R4_9BASI|nr:hypothetical protein PSTT_10574 [Puccinia striiformis]